MFILFEKYFAHCETNNLDDFDLMGFSDSEEKAAEWVAEHPVFRVYRYCPDVPL